MVFRALLVAVLAASCDALASGVAPVRGVGIARCASPVAQFGTANFERKVARESAKKKAARANTGAQVDLAGLATVAVSAVGVPFIVLGSVILGGPSPGLQLPSLPATAPKTVSAPTAPAAKAPGLFPPALLKTSEAPSAPRAAKVKAVPTSSSADLKSKALAKQEAARKAEKEKLAELEAKLKVPVLF